MLSGLICLILGYSLHLLEITPIIKRIATTSFTLASLGWCLLALCACYYLIDVREHRRNLNFFLVMGMNSIFIYLFFEIVGHRWFNEYIDSIIGGLSKIAGLPPSLGLILGSISIFCLEWGICYFLFKKKLFFKL